MPNRLSASTSPYLRQHADNPVDWYPWGEEALDRARREDKPILLSIGYSACHWCHVMAHESFEDPAVAAVMNDALREHQGRPRGAARPRPDLPDRARAADAALAAAGRSRCSSRRRVRRTMRGTYFPKEGRYGLPGFIDILPRIAQAYRRAGRDDCANRASGSLDAMQSLEPAEPQRTSLPARAPRRGSSPS